MAFKSLLSNITNRLGKPKRPSPATKSGIPYFNFILLLQWWTMLWWRNRHDNWRILTKGKVFNCTAWKMSIFGVFLVCIQSECGKIRIRKAPNTDTFHAVLCTFEKSVCWWEKILFISALIKDVQEMSQLFYHKWYPWFSPHYHHGIWNDYQAKGLRGASRPCQTFKMKLFVKLVEGPYFRKKLYLRCLTEFWISLWVFPNG